MKTILIANRGEIAVRIARTCRDLGLRAIALHSDLDAGALHVRVADDAVHLPGASAAETYLDVEAVITAARAAGADAVHPGYGFLAEHAGFARAVQDAGLTWIGPPPEAIAAMGDKVSARRAATAAGVAVVPGTTAPLTGHDEVVAFGDEHGWPVAVKASAGGGGRGMRVIERAADAARLVAAAAREAAAAFGDDRLYIERYLLAPRHLEVQLLADAHGTCVAVGDRDCSIQRRHQKLVEEAPAPGLAPDVRAAMAEAAVAVAQAVGYVGAGTVELLYEDGRFYFLEMNTRLQVEHTVTEAVSGLDLVAEQLRVATGEPLAAHVHDSAPRGHAIELRLNAEEPAGGRFLPAPGPIRRLTLPHGPGIRVDTGYEAGDVVSDRYDNLIAKLVVWAPDRASALRRARRALDELVVEGVPTTAPALAAVLAHPDFEAVAHATPWLEQHAEIVPAAPPRVAEPEPEPEPAARAPGRDVVTVNGRDYWVPSAEAPAADAGPTAVTAPPAFAPRRAAGAAPSDGAPALAVASPGAASSTVTAGAVTAPMQGRILLLHATVGETVRRGDVLCVIEAMKMEQEITAEHDGTVAEVRVAEGDGVGPGDVLVVVAA
ncbi:Carbamoyl-phosphate synthase large chain [Baekduia alba]|uniref:ATP-binding protein n=1 Tax=Baekduia alba TaxID=2997333 RepID=UPI002340B2B6|nr:biotin carboxylase N-terminal domain-containing protein [Baekduia alba]WCB95380.1 Carbamoyl-phosphate synthase large chain [Baekduia alba]